MRLSHMIGLVVPKPVHIKQLLSILNMMNIILIQVWGNAQQLVLALSNRIAAAWTSRLVSKCQGKVGQMALGGQMYGIAEAREANSSW